jgi:hypothetical protein
MSGGSGYERRQRAETLAATLRAILTEAAILDGETDITGGTFAAILDGAAHCQRHTP